MPATTEQPRRPQTAERRASPRVRARLAVFVLRRHDPSRSSLLASTHDVSLGGMFVEMKHPPRVGTVLEIEAFRPGLDDPPVRGQAVVRWRRRRQPPRGVGVEMLRLGEGDRERLSTWLEEISGPPGAA